MRRSSQAGTPQTATLPYKPRDATPAGPPREQARRHPSEGISVLKGILGDTQKVRWCNPTTSTPSFPLHQHRGMELFQFPEQTFTLSQHRPGAQPAPAVPTQGCSDIFSPFPC